MALDHLALLRAEVARMRAAVDTVPADAAVPACPGWTVEDLAEHLGRVHRWATLSLRSTQAPPGSDYPPAERDGQDLVDWYAGCAAVLLETLAAAPPDAPAWTFDPRDRTAGFWRRRQLHETLVHRVDADQAAGCSLLSNPEGSVEGLTAEVAADGLDEVLTVFMPRWLWRRRREPATDVYPLTRPLAVVCPDVGRSWTVVLVGSQLVVRDGVHDPQVRFTGPAVSTYLAVWGRAPRALVEVTGDAGLGADLLARAFTP